MYVVCRERIITSDRKAPLFFNYLTVSDHCGRPGRVKLGPDGMPAWQAAGWHCSHRGPGRRALTPLLVASARIDGKPRQRLVRRLPTVRTCCLPDAFLRAAWWHVVDEYFATLASGAWDGLVGHWEDFVGLLRESDELLADLRGIVPPPGEVAAARFRAFAAAEQAAREAIDLGVRESMRLRREEQERPLAEEASRQRAGGCRPGDRKGPAMSAAEAVAELDRLARERRPHGYGGGGSAGRGGPAMSAAEAVENLARLAAKRFPASTGLWEKWRRERKEEQRRQEELRREQERRQEERRRQEELRRREACPSRRPAWCDVLGLPEAASVDEINARFRKLAVWDHPDRGGDPATFIRINKAREDAVAYATR